MDVSVNFTRIAYFHISLMVVFNSFGKSLSE